MVHTSKFPFGIYWWILEKQKKQTFEKMKKIAGDIIILHMCTKNHNHMRYSYWDTKWDKNFCHFGPFFAFLTPLSPNNPQNQNFKKLEKTSGKVIILNLYNKKTRSYDSCLLTLLTLLTLCLYNACTDIMFCHFRPYFAFLPHYWPQKLKFGKNLKKHLDIWSFCTCVPLIKIIWCMFTEIWSSIDRIFLSSWATFCPLSP